MQFETHYKIELAVGDDSRGPLAFVNYDAEKKRLIATNGHVLASVPCTPDEGDHGVLLSVDSIKAARKANKSTPTLLCNGVAKVPNGPQFEHPDAWLKFPEWMRVLPTFDTLSRGTVTVAINPALLMTLAKALGAEKGVVLTLNLANMDGPIRVVGSSASNDGLGVLMPMRTLTDSEKKHQEARLAVMVEADKAP